MLADLSPARRRFVVAAAALALVGLVVVVVAVLATRPSPVAPVRQDALGPVLLVPGYGGSTTSLDVMAAALRRTGRDVTVVRPPGDGTGDLRAQAKALGDAIDRVRAASDATTVDVVGYSAGGVVARVWVDDFGGDRLARRVVTLSSPNHGTELAALAGDVTGAACPLACRQLEPDSDLIRRLNRDETPPGPRWVAIWTTSDKTVVPPTSGSLSGALDFAVQDVCPGVVVAHGDMPRTASVIAMVESELGTAAPTIPDRTLCRPASP